VNQSQEVPWAGNFLRGAIWGPKREILSSYAAIAAAQNLIAAKLTPDRAKKLVSESIKALKSNLK
jgi:hypothetical protein